MSYYGIKDLSIIKTNTGYNMKCKYYDSSIRSYEGYRVWDKTNKFYNTDFITREELEYDIFKNFLDGNFHTSSNCGKYSSLSWTNRKIKLTDEQIKLISKLHDDYFYCTNSPLKEQLRSIYNSTRYEMYYTAWQDYLKHVKNYKHNKFIIQLDAQGYKDIYIRSMGTRTIKYTHYVEWAKVFTGCPDDILEKLKGWKNQSNIKVIPLDK